MVREYNAKQNQLVAEFLSTVAAAWFSAGVVAPFFQRDWPFLGGLPFTLSGTTFAVAFLFVGVYLLKENDQS